MLSHVSTLLQILRPENVRMKSTEIRWCVQRNAREFPRDSGMHGIRTVVYGVHSPPAPLTIGTRPFPIFKTTETRLRLGWPDGLPFEAF